MGLCTVCHSASNFLVNGHSFLKMFCIQMKNAAKPIQRNNWKFGNKAVNLKQISWYMKSATTDSFVLQRSMTDKEFWRVNTRHGKPAYIQCLFKICCI